MMNSTTVHCGLRRAGHSKFLGVLAFSFSLTDTKATKETRAQSVFNERNLLEEGVLRGIRVTRLSQLVGENFLRCTWKFLRVLSLLTRRDVSPGRSSIFELHH